MHGVNKRGGNLLYFTLGYGVKALNFEMGQKVFGSLNILLFEIPKVEQIL